ncbi:rod shape-determining protein RodA [bacterium]|nr:rod shape-determining protein RodA [bacterium]
MTGTEYSQKEGLKIDPGIAVFTIFLSFCGLILIYSASSSLNLPFFKSPVGRQIIWLVPAVIAGILSAKIKISIVYETAYIFYGFAFLLIILVLFVGRGSVSRWISFGGIQFQPSEFAKISVILCLSRYFSDSARTPEWKRMFVSLLIVVPYFLLIAEEPDMGTAILFLFIWAVMAVWAGISLNWIFLLVAPFAVLLSGFYLPAFIIVAAGITVWAFVWLKKWWAASLYSVFCGVAGVFSGFFWSKLAAYQQERILIFLGIKSDPHGSAYQVIQSKVAIGSGGFLGKGFLHGSQSQLRFLPEQHTDFIISLLGEEFGFLGITVVFIFYFLLLASLISVARLARDDFDSLVSAGVFGLIVSQIVINSGMAVGLFPVTGMALPFLSYGGSSLVMLFILMGLVSNISVKRFIY